MKQYLLAVHDTGESPYATEEQMQQAYQDVDAFNQKLQAQGSWVFAGGLMPAELATVVKVQDGQVITTDGPFAEGKEQIGGFWVIQAEDLDQALKLAAEASVACQNPVEVRPFQDEQ